MSDSTDANLPLPDHAALLAHAMRLPEVAAMVEALSGMLAIWEKTYYGGGAQHVRNADIEKHSHVMRAALAALKAKP
jgi:hypothetical protein